MSEPITTIGAAILSKLYGIFFAFGGAILTLSFRDHDDNKSLVLVFINLVGSWFIGFALGDAVIEHFQITTSLAGLIYAVSATVGLILIGGAIRLAISFRDNPQKFMNDIMKKGGK